MYVRSNSLTVHSGFSFPAAARSTEPEIFTFERIPAQATAVRSFVPVRPKRRCTRVMYPAKVRMHLPPAERSPAKRWLLALCLVVLWQIYTEEPCADTPPGSADIAAAELRVLPFQSAEERARQLTDEALAGLPQACERNLAGAESSLPEHRLAEDRGLSNSSSPSMETSSRFDHSAGNGYMVALLVYHRLGGDN